MKLNNDQILPQATIKLELILRKQKRRTEINLSQFLNQSQNPSKITSVEGKMLTNQNRRTNKKQTSQGTKKKIRRAHQSVNNLMICLTTQKVTATKLERRMKNLRSVVQLPKP